MRHTLGILAVLSFSLLLLVAILNVSENPGSGVRDPGNESVDDWYRTTILNNPRLLLVDFSADWCVYCRDQHQILKRLVPEYSGQVDIVEVNVDRRPDLAAFFQVNGLPTLLLMKDGKVLMRGAGLVPYENVKTALDSHLGGEAGVPEEKSPEVSPHPATAPQMLRPGQTA